MGLRHAVWAGALGAVVALTSGCGLLLDELYDSDGSDGSVAPGRDGSVPDVDGSPRRDGGPGADGGTDADVVSPTDAEIPGDAGGCAWRFDTPVRLDAVSILDDDDWAPSVSADQLTLYFDSYIGGGNDLFMSTRPDTTSTFSARTSMALTTTCIDGQPRSSDDGLELFFISTRRAMRGGCEARSDIFVSTRGSTMDTFAAAALVEGVNEAGSWEEGPFPSTDGLRLYFGSNRDGTMDVFVASRPARGDPFAPAAAIGELNSGTSDRMPTLSADERVVLFSSDRPGGAGGYDLWMATRADTTATFDAPVPVPGINTAADELFPYLTRDGMFLYLSWNTSLSGGTDADLYVAARICM